MTRKGRKPREGVTRRPQLRLKEDEAAIYDRYSIEEISSIMGIALRSIPPNLELGISQPTIVKPASAKTKTLCRVIIEENWVRLLFPEKHNEFRGIVKKHKFQWSSPYWQRKTSQVSTAIEIVNVLLSQGFCLWVSHTEVVNVAISGNFTPEPLKKISVIQTGTYKDWFTFSYPKEDDFYQEILKIPSAKYIDGALLVAPEYYLEVCDFSKIHGFRFSETGLVVVQKYIDLLDKASVVEIIQPPLISQVSFTEAGNDELFDDPL